MPWNELDGFKSHRNFREELETELLASWSQSFNEVVGRVADAPKENILERAQELGQLSSKFLAARKHRADEWEKALAHYQKMNAPQRAN